jgi:hypothetical protein
VATILEKVGIKADFTMVPGVVDAKTLRYFVPRIGVSHVNDRILVQVKILGLLGRVVKVKPRLLSVIPALL